MDQNIEFTEECEFTEEDIKQNKLYAVLAYLGWLVFIPLLAAKESRFARYHTNQGLILVIISFVLVAISIVDFVLVLISSLCGLLLLGLIISALFLTVILAVSVPLLIFQIIGIINAASGKAKSLPLIGKFKILKMQQDAEPNCSST
ncbi:MAG: zinc ribbon domain-containing protein [Clostridia bacterium]|nr:zinc ribbon domain-containing protein [Clostridia bacterium]